MIITLSNYSSVQPLSFEIPLYSASNSAPSWAKHLPKINSAVPSWHLVNKLKKNEMDWSLFAQLFIAHLSLESLGASLSRIKVPEIYMLCWCDDFKHCHLSLLQEPIADLGHSVRIYYPRKTGAKK